MTPRARRIGIALLIAALILLAGALSARGALYYQTGDFFCLYQGARSVATGHDPYDAAWWGSVTGGLFPDPWRGTGTSSCTSHYAYPLWTAVALVPFGLLPLELAASLWMALSIAAAVFGASWLWRAYRGGRREAAIFAAVVFSSQPFWVLLVGGQITGVLLGLTGLAALSLARRQDASAGVAVASLALKPQLAVLTVPALGVRAILDRRRRAVAAGLATLAAMLVVPFVAAPAWPAEWLGVVGPQRAVITGMLPTAWGFAGDVLGNVAWGAAISVAAIGAVVAISRRVDDLALLALASPLSLVVTPHAWSYDFLLLAAPWAFVLSRAARAPSTTRMLLLVALLVVASPLPWILYGVGFRRGLETLSVTIPIATALLAAIATRLPAETAATRPASA